ncbi:MAG: DUF4296 domain-containing protein [Bacteroidaceae bacterium]
MRLHFHSSMCKALLFAAILVAVSSCAVRAPKGILSTQEMEDFLVDYHKAKAIGITSPDQTATDKDKYIAFVYDKHGITEAQFDSSVSWYSQHIETYSDIYQRVNKRTQAEKDALNTLISLRTHEQLPVTAGDSVDLWYLQRNVLMSGLVTENRLQFDIRADRAFEDKDSIYYKAFFRPLSADSIAAYMTLQLTYAKGSTSKTVCADSLGWYAIKLQNDTLGGIKYVKGFIYLDARDIYYPQLLVDSIQLIRLHQSKEQAMQIADSMAVVIKEQAVSDKEKFKLSIGDAEPVLKKEPTRRLSPKELRSKEFNKGEEPQQVKKADNIKLSK